jgi:hypothetical protein
MKRKGNRDTAKVDTAVVEAIPPTPEVPTAAPVQTKPEYIPQPCVYALFINDKVVYQDGQPPEIQGKWYVVYINTATVDTCYGPYPLFDNTGQPLVGFVVLDLLKDIARQMWNGDLGNYQQSAFQLMSAGMKIMSCMVYVS